MNAFDLNFLKLNGIRFRTNVKTDYEFTTIMEKLLYQNPVSFQYEQGNIKLVASNFVISTEDTRNVVYEIDMDALESVVFGEENADIPRRVKMYIKGHIARIETYAAEELKQDSEEEAQVKSNIIPFPVEHRPSVLKGIIVDEKLSVPVHEKIFWQVIQKLEKLHMKYHVETVINHIVGHAIEFENLSIKGRDFELVFHDQRLLHAYFGASIADTSYFTTTKGKKHNIGQIVRKELKGEKFVQVEGYGADDAWHYARDDSHEYVYQMGYNV